MIDYYCWRKAGYNYLKVNRMIVIISDRISSLWGSFACSMMGLESITLGIKPLLLLNSEEKFIINPLYRIQETGTMSSILNFNNVDLHQSLLLQFTNFTKDFFLYSEIPWIFNNIANPNDKKSLVFHNQQCFLHNPEDNNNNSTDVLVKYIINCTNGDVLKNFPWKDKLYSIEKATLLQEIEQIVTYIGIIYNLSNSFNNCNLLPHSTTTGTKILEYAQEFHGKV
jgi:hypothetical protein